MLSVTSTAIQTVLPFFFFKYFVEWGSPNVTSKKQMFDNASVFIAFFYLVCILFFAHTRIHNLQPFPVTAFFPLNESVCFQVALRTVLRN